MESECALWKGIEARTSDGQMRTKQVRTAKEDLYGLSRQGREEAGGPHPANVVSIAMSTKQGESDGGIIVASGTANPGYFPSWRIWWSRNPLIALAGCGCAPVVALSAEKMLPRG